MTMKGLHNKAVVLALALCAASVGAREPGIEIDARLFIDSEPPCLSVRNQGLDVIAEYVDESGEVTARAASWLGREGRYLLRRPGNDEVRVELRSLRGHPMRAGAYRLEPCPPDFPETAVLALARAQDLRMWRYFGEAVESEQIETHLLAAIEAMSDQAPREWQAVAHFETGAFYRDTNRLTEAGVHYARAVDLFAAIADLPGQAAAINAMGLVAWRQGELDAAWDYFEQALDLRSAGDEEFPIAIIANNLALLLTQRGDHDQALNYYHVALSILQGPVDLRREVMAAEVAGLVDQFEGAADLPLALNLLNNLALLQRDRGRTDLAERYWRNYLVLEYHLTRATAAAQARSNLGRMLLREARLDEALMLLIDALAQFETAGAPRWVAEASIGLSQLYAMLGDLDTAMGYADRAAEAAREDATVRADALRTQGLLALQNADWQDAVDLFTEAAGLLGPGRSPLRWRLILSDLAHARFLGGNPERALADQKALLEEVRRLDNARGAAVVESRIGAIEMSSGRDNRARKALESALTGHKLAGDRVSEFETLERLGRLLQAHSLAEAIERNFEAIELFESMRAGQLPPLRRAEFLATARELFDRQVIALAAGGEQSQAWQVAEVARTSGLRDLIEARMRRHHWPERRELLDEHAGLIARMHQARPYRAALSAESDGPGTLAFLQRELDQVESRLVALDQRDQVMPAAVDPQSIQAGLGPNRLMLSYYLAGDSGLVWVIRADEIDVVFLEELEGLGGIIEDLLKRLRHPRQALGQARRHLDMLAQLLIDPIGVNPDRFTEMFIQADGVLHSLPFELLLSVREDENSTRRTPAISRVLSAGSVADHHQVRSAANTLVVMADPGWHVDAEESVVFPGESLVGRLIRDQSLAALPGTRREAMAIAELAGPDAGVRIRLGPRATREFVAGGGLSGHRLVHIATHGLVDLEYPMLSSLLLASDHGLGPAFLRPHEIIELDLDAELVTLSACETGYGRILAGEGALSLARPFLIAGADQVLSSLWKVDDHRTTEFMTRFYRQLLVEESNATEALARTIEHIRRQPATAHPYYWAGFFLTRAVPPGR